MKSEGHGQGTSHVEVKSILAHGFGLTVHGRELFLPFEKFPWFKDASIGQVFNVELPSEQHLYWPDLDIDLAIESIEFPERYPLVSRVKPERTKDSSVTDAKGKQRR